MKATEFCYWLQGAFELGGMPALTMTGIDCIRKHLELVKVTPQVREPVGAIEFCDWLRGGLDFISHEDLNHTETVRSKLSAAFIHSIDPTYANQENLKEIHGPGMRC